MEARIIDGGSVRPAASRRVRKFVTVEELANVMACGCLEGSPNTCFRSEMEVSGMRVR